MNNNFVMKGVSIVTVVLIGALTASPVMAYTKDETVYGKMYSDGYNYSTIVSSHLKNTDSTELLSDMANLLNIKNINGDETFEKGDSNILKWNSNGNDIYYQGDSEETIPIECSIKYELDGEEISAKDLAGKSGRVKITMEYKNADSHSVKINGKYVTMYTPFVVMTGTILDNTIAKNITVTTGKIVDNGTKTLIAGVTCPGLQESLDIDSEDLDLPSNIELEFDATDFEMSNIISYVTPKLIEESDFSNLEKLDDLYSKVSKLSSSSTQLVQGAKDVKNGVNTYTEAISDGLTQIEDGVNAGKNKATSALSNSADTLAAGIDQIIEGKDTEAETIKTQVIENGNEALKQGLQTKVSAGAKATAGATLEAVLDNEQLSTALGLDLTDTQKAALVSALKTNMDTTALEAGIAAGIDEATIKEKAGIDAINNNEAGVKTGLETLRNQAVENIKAGVTSISSGFDSISSAINIANKKSVAGANELNSGLEKFTNGIEEFDEEGIQEIANLVNGNVKNLQERIEALKDLASEYNNFSGIDESAEEGTVKFILMTDSIKKGN